MRSFVRAALVAAAIAVPASAHANLVTNGNFSSTCADASFCTYSSGNSTGVTDWTVGSGSVDLITGYWQSPPAGGNSIDLDGNSPGSIYTTFATITGQTYLVTFEVSGNPDGGDPSKLGIVAAAANSQNFSFTTGANNHTAMNYEQVTFQFTATAATTTLTFTSANTGNSPYGVVLGNIDVAAAHAVPEPITLSLMGAGLAGIGALRRRRK